MRIGQVIGTVTLNCWHPSLSGARYKLVVPLSLANLTADTDDAKSGVQGEIAEEIAVFDSLGAGIGHRIALSESREAAMPFHPEGKPIDAYNAAILDHVEIRLAAKDL